MALRLGRGLFRLWLVLSMLWIGGVGVVTWLETKIILWWEASIFALVPPLFVLALGSALVWALRGFGDEPKEKV